MVLDLTRMVSIGSSRQEATLLGASSTRGLLVTGVELAETRIVRLQQTGSGAQLEEVRRGRMLGRGQFGVVYETTLLPSGRRVAMKVIRGAGAEKAIDEALRMRYVACSCCSAFVVG
jgi:hypothetical protein